MALGKQFPVFRRHGDSSQCWEELAHWHCYYPEDQNCEFKTCSRGVVDILIAVNVQHNWITEDHLFVLQLLEQDRHLLRRKLESTQSECDTRLLELQTDIRELNQTLAERETSLKHTEREKAILISELTEQNQRLTNSLKEVRSVRVHTGKEISFQTDSVQLGPHYNHQRRRLYSPAWVLASSIKCRQWPLSWASPRQFLQPSFLASSSTPSVHFDFGERSRCQCLILIRSVSLAANHCVLLHVVLEVSSVQLHFLEVSYLYVFYELGVVSLTPNPQLGGSEYPFLSGSSPLTCLTWKALTVAYATANIALGIIWPHKPHHYVKVRIPSEWIIISNTKRFRLETMMPSGVTNSDYLDSELAKSLD